MSELPSFIITGKRPIKLWAREDSVEPAAMQQLKNIASMPFIYKHVAVMPDVHLGKGATVGSVIATENCIMPAAVGVDIGCGMAAVKTDLPPGAVRDRLKQLRSDIESMIPVGTSGNLAIEDEVLSWSGWAKWKDLNAKGADEESLKLKALSQFGSLGGGNHFIEVCLDKKNNVWLMLHSGSRGIGNVLARRHIDEAKDLMKRMCISLPDPDLAYFARGVKGFDEYMFDLYWAQAYALGNREEMLRRLMNIFRKAFGWFKTSLTVHCHHNYVAIENHYGANVFVTRKGAVKASAGEYGIIPGSMGTKSYIVRGLGNRDSFNSCSHGAGRRMSRSEARRRFTVEDMERETAGVECRKDNDVIDEIPSSYKDIDEVMANQKDLVEVVAELKQILCVKGGD